MTDVAEEHKFEHTKMEEPDEIKPTESSKEVRESKKIRRLISPLFQVTLFSLKLQRSFIGEIL